MFRSDAFIAELSVVVFCSVWSYHIIVLQSGQQMTNHRLPCKSPQSHQHFLSSKVYRKGQTVHVRLKVNMELRLKSRLLSGYSTFSHKTLSTNSAPPSFQIVWSGVFLPPSASSRPHVFLQTLRYFTYCLGAQENNAQRKHVLGHQLSCDVEQDMIVSE